MNAKAMNRVRVLLAATALALISSMSALAADTGQPGAASERVCQIKLDLNRATPSELAQIPGISGAVAAGIVAYRESHGPYRDIADLLAVRDVDMSSFSLLRDKVEVRAFWDGSEAFATTDGAYLWSCVGS